MLWELYVSAVWETLNFLICFTTLICGHYSGVIKSAITAYLKNVILKKITLWI